MMFCRAAWQRLAPLARKARFPLSHNAVPVQQMSVGLPASGTNIAYVVLGGGSLTAALVYAYKTINSDSARYNDRIAQIEARSKRAVVAFAEAAAAVELSATAEAAAIKLISEALAAEPTNDAADSPAEPVDAVAVEVEESVATSAVVEAVTAHAEEPIESDAEDVAADAAAPVAVTTAVPVSGLLSTVRIIAGSTAEIAAASVGDQHLVAAVRLDEEKHSEETLNGVEIPDVKVLVLEEEELSVSEKAVNESDERRADAEGMELEELPASEEINTIVNYGGTEANNPVEMEVTGEQEVASEEPSGEIENDLTWEEAVSSVVMLPDEDSISGDVTSVAVEEDKALCHDTDGLEDFTESLAALKQDLQATTGSAGEDDVFEKVVDAVEELEPVEATETAVESENGMIAMEQE